MARDWAHLPPELLQSIAARITQIPDLIRFSSVCIQWRSAAKSISKLLPPQFPWLLLPAVDDRTTNHRLFFNLADNRSYNLPLPEARWTRAKNVHSTGAGGWLLTTEDRVNLALFNPLTHSSISLPTLPSTENTAAYWYMKAKVFGSDLFAALFPNVGDIFICKLGESSWRRIGGERFPSSTDFVYHDGKFYVRRFWEILSVFDAHTLEKVGQVTVPSLMGSTVHDCLVESPQGELLLVRMKHASKSKRFELFKLDLSEEKIAFVEVTSIGDNVLFVDSDHAMAFCAGDFEGCRGNCIYFVDYVDEKKDKEMMMLFDIERSQIEQDPLFSFPSEGHGRWGYAKWVVPSLGY